MSEVRADRRGRRSTISMQELLDAGLNAFGAELLAESINGHREREQLRKPFSFMLKDVIFTLSLTPEYEWTRGELLDILTPIAAIESMPATELINFARAFVGADDELRGQLTHAAIYLIDRYSLWPYRCPRCRGLRGEHAEDCEAKQ